MNRRGNIGTLMLVFGALILVIYALYFMISFNGNFGVSKNELRDISDKAEINHELILDNVNKMVLSSIQASASSGNFEKSFNESLKGLAIPYRISGLDNNVYAKIAVGDYSLKFDGSAYALSVNGLFESYKSGQNEIRYDYSASVLFDKTRLISFFNNTP